MTCRGAGRGLCGVASRQLFPTSEMLVHIADDIVNVPDEPAAALFVSYRTEMINALTQREIVVHNRIPDMLASLKVGFDILLEYLCGNEQIGKDDVISFRKTFDEILIANVSKSSSLVENENISNQFCEKLESLIDSGSCSKLNIQAEAPVPDRR